MGCARESTTPPTAAEARKPADEPLSPSIRGDGLYRDEEIRKLSPVDIDAHTASGSASIGLPILPVVPAGAVKPRAQVFQELGLADRRVRDFRIEPVHMVAFLTWQVSPSYDLCCMTAAYLGEEEVPFQDPARKVYGVRLLKRP